VREKCGILAVPRTVHVSRTLRMSVFQSTAGSSAFTLWLHYQLMSQLQLLVRNCKKCLLCFPKWNTWYCDMHFVYEFCNDNARAAVDEYKQLFPHRKISSRGVFSRIHQTMR
jgi:hypothetical protein